MTKTFLKRVAKVMEQLDKGIILESEARAEIFAIVWDDPDDE